jgi:hypothetical protein
LVRSREKFAAHNFTVVLADAPLDQQHGMNAIFRMSSADAGDIGAVANCLKAKRPCPYG